MKKPGNSSEINLYYYLGEALFKSQMVEQALNYSITLKMNPSETKEVADEFLKSKRKQKYTLGKSIGFAEKNKLYSISLQNELNAFNSQRIWLVHCLIIGNEEEINRSNIKKELLDKIKAVSNQSESIQRLIEDDMRDFVFLKRNQ